MYKFLVCEPIAKAGFDVLSAAGEVRMASAPDSDTVIAEIGDIDGVLTRGKTSMTRQVMEHAPKLKVIGRHGVGVDNIDLDAATDLGIQVVNTPQATVEGVAEHAVGLMLALSKRIVFADKQIRVGNFEVRDAITGREMLGRTLGVIGFGRIGQRVAKMCHYGLDMPILYSDIVSVPEMEKALGARKVNMDEILRTADYISVHVPLIPATRGLIGEAEFAKMRPETMFINTSRGPVVDEAALYKALVENRIAGAAIDVFEQEPASADNPLFALDNIVVTPHIASSTEEAKRGMSLVAEDIVAVLQGRAPKYPVNRLP
jgi:D-3-phosphoglycerate dehydrogenase